MVEDQPTTPVTVRVRVRPRSRPGLVWQGGELLIRVAAAPVEGKATEEARRALAGALGLPSSGVHLRSGGRSRSKVFTVEGLTAEEVSARLRRAGDPDERGFPHRAGPG
jgi:uncharacterized protein